MAAVSRALEAQKESEFHEKEAEQWRSKYTEANRQLEASNRALSMIPHPQGYLTNKNRDLEDTISKQQITIAERDKAVSELTEQLAAATEAKAHVSHRLEQLLRQRAEVEGLRVLLERMQQYEETEVNASSSESESEESDGSMAPCGAPVQPRGTERRKSRWGCDTAVLLLCCCCVTVMWCLCSMP